MEKISSQNILISDYLHKQQTAAIMRLGMTLKVVQK